MTDDPNISFVTIMNGKAVALNKYGNHTYTYGGDGAVDVQRQGDDVMVRFSNCESRIFTLRGIFKRKL